MLQEIVKPGFDRRMTRDEINAKPIGRYEGKIKIVKTNEELDKAIGHLLNEKILGFDTETKPAFQKGRQNLPSVLQLAGRDTVYIFQLKQLHLPRKLCKILSAKTIIKAGVAISFDLLQLKKISKFNEEAFIDLAAVAKSAGVRNYGLRSLAAVLLDFRIAKGAQQSNWARDELTPKQILYAATDAWASREIYLKLKKMRAV